MALGIGGLALRRFQVLEAPQSVTWQWVLEHLEAAAISPIGVEEPREEALGWCHPFTGDPAGKGNLGSQVYDGAMVFGLRIDSKKIPGTLFRLQLKSALDALSRVTPDAPVGARLSKNTRELAKERIKQELLLRTLPSVRLVEVVWFLNSGEIWLLSPGTAMSDVFQKLFEETFGLPLVPRVPGTLAIDLDKALRGLPVPLGEVVDLLPVDLMAEPEAAIEVPVTGMNALKAEEAFF